MSDSFLFTEICCVLTQRSFFGILNNWNNINVLGEKF